MSCQLHTDKITVVELLAPAADAAGRTSAIYADLRTAKKARIIATLTQGAADTVLLAPKQATAAAGTGTKVLASAVQIYVNLDTAAGSTFTKATDAVNYTTDAGVKNKIVIFEIDLARLDVEGGFAYLGLTTGASNAANITQAVCEIENAY